MRKKGVICSEDDEMGKMVLNIHHHVVTSEHEKKHPTPRSGCSSSTIIRTIYGKHDKTAKACKNFGCCVNLLSLSNPWCHTG